MKSWLKTQHSENKDHGIRSHHFKANRNGETMETVTDFIILGSKITADGDCRHEIKRCLLLGRKAMTWRRKWQPTLVFLPGESHGGRSLVGYSPWGCKESDTTEGLDFTSLSRPSDRYCRSRSNIPGVALLPTSVSRVDVPTPSVSQPPDSACPSSWCLLGQDPCGQRGACMIT